MKYSKEDFEQAEWLASNFIEGGLAFAEARRTGFRRGRIKPGRPVAVTDPDEVRRLGLMPTEALAEAVQKAMLIRHEQFQLEKKRKSKGAFYRGKDWLSLRYRVLSERGGKCECCGASAKDGAKLHVDHIKPRSLYPELELEKSNLQVLCGACNIGKSNRHEDDWRHDKPKRVLVKKSPVTGG